MQIVFRYPQPLEVMREALRTLPRDIDVVTDETVDLLCQGFKHGWLVNYSHLPQADDDFQVGASKFGGRPDVPPGWTWPLGALDQPLGFLLQVNLANLDVTADGYPADGLLSLYWDPNTGSGQVDYASPGSPLGRFQEDTPIQNPLEEWQLISPSAVMLLAERRWMESLADLPVVFDEDGLPGAGQEVVRQLAPPAVAAYYELCDAVVQPPEVIPWADEDSVLLFASGVPSGLFDHLSVFDLLPDQADWRLIFDIRFADAPPFTDCYTGHNIGYQMRIKVTDLQALEFGRTVITSSGEG
ncbi:DUF1963 domain-containing protein (plasmid) [Deinococcus radiomollis]|uniref:DUF1963 domain-containing protein n=1 Tax=Deinococcus radiomollis TaxID=468916 RepID=UPI003891CD3A